ncbi:ADP-ribosylation factor-like protein 3 [Acanthaster planci]|uniref:ADP-ribosylation factor-like protein 3 n=1 Tax=Acanthaster planci TaxID=133434 RepID=A0A8B7XJ50_ACAPL|nr:ADP-ribosylation factor-like protein 3 [Acanthaster planci]
MADRLNWLNDLSLGKRALLFIGSGAVVAGVVYAVLRHRRKSIEGQSRDMAIQEEAQTPQDLPEKRILVLGLDNSGKSSLLRCLTHSEHTGPPDPTEGFNVMCVQTQNVTLNIWEVGGQQSVRSYWENFVKGTDVLVFVVDAVDQARFPEAKEELHKLLADERLKNVPLVLIANKQDQAAAKRGADFISALTPSVPSQEREVHVVETQTVLNAGSDNIQQIMDLMVSLSRD